MPEGTPARSSQTQAAEGQLASCQGTCGVRAVGPWVGALMS